MASHTRREFLSRSAAGAAALAARLRAQTADAELIVLNARVYTVDAAMPRAEAFAVSGGRFLAVGTNAAIKARAGKSTRTIDAKQMTVVPGFIDTHNHAGGTTLLYEVLVGNPFEVEFVTIASIIEKLRAKAAQTPPGMWVEGYFHDDTKLKDKRPLNARDLDQVSRDHPVVVRHRGGHTSFYNSKAFELAGITKNTPNPEGGTFDRDASGELNGRVTDRAIGAMGRAGKRPTYTPEQQAQRSRAGIAHISRKFVEYGLTTVHHSGGDLAALRDVRAKGELRHRVNYELSGGALNQAIEGGPKSGDGDEWIRYGSTTEHTVDGSFSERTMAMSVPYKGIDPPYKGNVTESQDTLNAWVERVHRAGVQVNCHANGDVAIDMYLTALERAQKLFPRANARPKITHCTMINDDLIRRIKALDAIPAMFTTYTYYNTDKFPFYGEDVMKRCLAYRTMLDAGIHAAAGSDFAPGPFAPLMGIQGMVTRTGWDGTTWGANQRVSVEQAIRINTLHGAYASNEESIKGSITPGKLADFVMLGGDPHTVKPHTIKDIPVMATAVGGVIQLQRDIRSE